MTITHEEIAYIREGIEYHLACMVEQLRAYADGEQPEGQKTTPRNKVRYEAHAIEYLLNDVEQNMQTGKPIPRVIANE